MMMAETEDDSPIPAEVELKTRIRQLVLDASPCSQYITISEYPSGMDNLRLFSAKYIAANSDIERLLFLVDIDTHEVVATYASKIGIPRVGP